MKGLRFVALLSMITLGSLAAAINAVNVLPVVAPTSAARVSTASDPPASRQAVPKSDRGRTDLRTTVPNGTAGGTMPPSTTTTAVPDSTPRCIIVIEGASYDVTDLRTSHPGGDIFQCGTDMTQIFFSQHNQALLDGAMARYRIP